ncbi:hypothetical protein PCANC_11584 [Puccinia coronata f. sp. avenae]|uniref:C2 domain-containing protein n=1 Tax=Puccinia coronata f. sp. avenae TaxID=200324 RepID=A0A2N5RYW0_9BASI|nr:hypothetical protein PCASD_26559 [Puccinia coronata f. sp. avenae]PLW46084.1 hypothetical protein PCANC_11584 [Puccinia coronata f. sp. avenae]
MAGPLGTLIVVVLKARNLPNKQRIGKQDPYATCTYLSHRKRTKTDKRGGQHPVWDDELRFDIYENPKDAMASASVSTTATGGIVPVKSNAPPIGSAGSAGVKELRVAVYADDPRDPNLIGEGKVDLTDTLKKGEFDDWVTVTNKGKYQGEVYLEMTFYSAKPPPEKLHTPTGPARAGVFEASSPGSGLRPTQAIASASPLNDKKTPSPLGTPSKKINPASVPVALRPGRPISGPIPSGHLPLPGEPSTSKDANLNPRQRSTGSLSMPTPDFGLEDRSPSRSPSRNHSVDRADCLTNSLNSLSLSARPSANNNLHLHLPQPTPSEMHVQHPSQPRHHRHSFSGHSHLQANEPTQQTHSASSSIHGTDFSHDHFHDHSTPPFVAQSYPDCLPASAQPSGIPRPVFPARRPLPIPGGDTVHRPTFNLPPPPPGQTPVPIHEVFGASTGRPFPSAPPTGYPPPAGFSTQQPQVVQMMQSPTRPNANGGENVYSYPPTHHQDQLHQHNQPYAPSVENPPSNNNSYQLQNAPPLPPPPPHIPQQPYHSFHVQQAQSGIPAPLPPPPGPPSQMYYQPVYAPPPPPTPAPSFTPPHPQNYPEYNNPFHTLSRPASAVPGNVYIRPSPSPAPLPPPPPPPHGQPLAHHPPPPSQSFTPFYPPNGYQAYPSSYQS